MIRPGVTVVSVTRVERRGDSMRVTVKDSDGNELTWSVFPYETPLKFARKRKRARLHRMSEPKMPPDSVFVLWDPNEGEFCGDPYADPIEAYACAVNGLGAVEYHRRTVTPPQPRDVSRDVWVKKVRYVPYSQLEAHRRDSELLDAILDAYLAAGVDGFGDTLERAIAERAKR